METPSFHTINRSVARALCAHELFTCQALASVCASPQQFSVHRGTSFCFTSAEFSFSWRFFCSGSIWIFLDLSGSIWIFLDLSGSIWIYLDLPASFWILLDLSGSLGTLIFPLQILSKICPKFVTNQTINPPSHQKSTGFPIRSVGEQVQSLIRLPIHFIANCTELRSGRDAEKRRRETKVRFAEICNALSKHYQRETAKK